VQEYIRKGVIERINLPLFVKTKSGDMVQIGMKNVIDVPNHLLPPDNDVVIECNKLAVSITDDKELQSVFASIFLDAQSEKYDQTVKKFDKKYRYHEKKDSYLAAKNKALDVINDNMRQLLQQATDLKDHIKSQIK
jgi:hypothetical protein